MASSTINIIREEARRALTTDDKFYKKLIYFFELRVPASLGATGTSFLFPLALNPTELTMEEPFTVEETPTQGGGLYVEENGIVRRTLRIRGNTGFKPRKLGADAGIGYLPYPQKRSFGREINPLILDELSGQKHFQWLQDKVFRAYGDLKRDPTTSQDTKLIFHNQKDDEHWLVAPQQFSLSRSAARPTMYEYNIELLVIDTAEAEVLTLSEDKSIFEQIKDVVRQIQAVIDLYTGLLQDINAVIGEVRSTLAAIDNIVDSVTGIVDACTDFVNGVTSLINVPFTFVSSTIELIEANNAYMSAVEDLEKNSWPENFRNTMRQLQDTTELLASYPDKFQTPADVVIQAGINRQQLSTNSTKDEREEAKSPTSMDEYRNLGTGLTGGDASKSKADSRVGTAPPRYTSVRSQQITQGDTLASLAARYLGDARLWKNIAIINGLRPPFITDLEIRDLTKGQALPGTLGRGASILIPSLAPAPAALPTLTTYGVEPEEPYAVHLLGTDFMLESDDGGKTYDIPIDTERGSVDAKLISGIDNLRQGIRTRLDIEQGHDLLYRYIGVKRVVGLGSSVTDTEAAKFRIVEAITTDPRIAGLRRLDFLEGSSSDVLETDMTVEVRGFTETAQIHLEVR